MAKGKLFVISGPSGTGKGTICKSILENEADVKLSVSMTTRIPREDEVDKVHYYFVEQGIFEQLIDESGFMEYASVYGNYYGTPKKQVLQWLSQGNDVILEIDVQGALQVKKNYPQCVLIFILPPSFEELKSRIEGRGSETKETMTRRLGEALHEISFIGRYDYRIVNDDLHKAIAEVRGIITTERCKIDEGEALRIIGKYKEE
ncbi:MAG: guanylate kinase [Clostridiales bacterium]|nr:guanylate kinase [Clostridiales bacterium]